MFQLGRSIFLWALLTGLLVGCGGQPGTDTYQAGRPSRFVPGIPSFDFETVPSNPGEQPGVELYLSVPSASLTFEKAGNAFRAMQEIRVSLVHPEDQTLILERSWRDTTLVSTYAATQRYDPFIIRRHLGVPPGTYIAEATLENLSSGKSEVRRQPVVVPDSAEQNPYLGKILIEARTDRGTFLPVVPFHIPSSLDSLRCITKLYNIDPVRPSLVTIDLVRFISDTLPASPPMYLTVLDLPLGYGGVTFEKAETVLVGSQPLTIGRKDVILAMGIRGLPPGNYLASFQVQTPAREEVPRDTLLNVERFLSIGGPTFPRPSTLWELIESMEYIASREEMELLREAPTPEIARVRFDSLWLTFRHDKKAGGPGDDRTRHSPSRL